MSRLCLAVMAFSGLIAGPRLEALPRVRTTAGVLVEIQSSALRSAAAWQVSADPMWSVGAQSQPEPQVFGSVAGAVRLSTGIVVVADAQALDLRFFGADGELVHRVGSRGGGPGQFVTIAGLARCHGDSVFVFDPGQARLSVFDASGKLARTIDLRVVTHGGPPPRAFVCNGRGALGFQLRPMPGPPAGEGPHRPVASVLLLQPSGHVVTLGPFPGDERYYASGSDFPRPLGKRMVMALGDTVAYIGTGDDFRLDMFSLSGARLGSVRDTVARRVASGALITGFIEYQVAQRGSESRQASARRFYDRLQYPDTLPAYGDVRLGPEGRIWIQDYQLPGDVETRWRVYSARGVSVGTVVLPSRFELTAIGRDFVLGIWRDADAVESVRMYSLRHGREGLGR